MINKPLISVIIPVYNCEKYLEKCISSIINQTYPEIEILLIDDGSTDDSGIICDRYKSEKISVIHQKNSGQAAARNAGIKIAKGEYIGFVDSDDWIDHEMYEILLRDIENTGANIACCGIAKVTCNGLEYFNKNQSLSKIYSVSEALDLLVDNKIITSSPCDKLYKSEIIKNNLMREGVIFEDFDIMPRWLIESERILYNGQPLYFYRTNYNSTMSNHSKKRFEELYASKRRVEFYRKYAPNSVYKVECKNIEIAFNVLSYTRKTKGCKEERLEIVRDLRQKLKKFQNNNWSKTIKLKTFILRYLGLNVFDLCNFFYDAYKSILRKNNQKK